MNPHIEKKEGVVIFKWSEYRGGYTFNVGEGEGNKHFISPDALKTLFPEARLGRDFATDETAVKAASERVDKAASQ